MARSDNPEEHDSHVDARLDKRELVSFAQLRPSEKVFGPAAKAIKAKPAPRPRPAQDGTSQPGQPRQGAPRQQQQPGNGQPPRRPQPQRRPQEVDLRDQVDLRDGRSQGAPQGPRPQQPQARQQPIPQQRAQQPAPQQRPAQPAPRQPDAFEQYGRPVQAPQGRRPQQPMPQQARQPQRPAPQQPQARQQPAPQQRPSQMPQARQPQRPAPQQPQARQQPAPQPQRRPAPAKQYDDEYFHDFDGPARPVEAKPAQGWRGSILKATGVNLGLGGNEQKLNELVTTMRKPVTDGTVAVFSRKGGVGKTTISAYMGLTMAQLRGGRIVALDGDAEAGSLGWLLAPEAPSTLTALATANPVPDDYAELRQYTAKTDEGLEVIVGEPAEDGVVSTAGMQRVADQLARHYDVSIFDTGAGVTRATGRVLVNRARVLLLVMGPSVDSVRAAERTLAWLEERPGEAAAEDVQVIAVINGIPADAKKAHIERIESHFGDRCAAVVRIPWDAHLAQGSTAVSLDALAKPTRQAFVELAATAVDALSRSPQTSGNVGGVRRAS